MHTVPGAADGNAQVQQAKCYSKKNNETICTKSWSEKRMLFLCIQPEHLQGPARPGWYNSHIHVQQKSWSALAGLSFSWIHCPGISQPFLGPPTMQGSRSEGQRLKQRCNSMASGQPASRASYCVLIRPPTPTHPLGSPPVWHRALPQSVRLGVSHNNCIPLCHQEPLTSAPAEAMNQIHADGGGLFPLLVHRLSH